jgi:hypothetical protein
LSVGVFGRTPLELRERGLTFHEKTSGSAEGRTVATILATVSFFRCPAGLPFPLIPLFISPGLALIAAVLWYAALFTDLRRGTRCSPIQWCRTLY